MYYLYRHIRLDKNEPFYIGIGKSCNYARAYSRKSRNNLWHKIVNKTEYEVEIVFDNITKELVSEKEIEFIALYGRKDLNKGILVNMTDGGDGNINPSKECRDKISKANKGKKKSQEHIEAIKNSLNKLENREKRINAIRKNNTRIEYREKMSEIMSGKPKTQKHIENASNAKQKPINQLDMLGNFIKTWDSIKIAQDTLNIYNISKCCVGVIKQSKGFRFEYA